MGNQRLKPSLIWKHAEPGGFLHKAGFKGTSVIDNVERSFLERPHSGSELGFEGGSLLFFGPYLGGRHWPCHSLFCGRAPHPQKGSNLTPLPQALKGVKQVVPAKRSAQLQPLREKHAVFSSTTCTNASDVKYVSPSPHISQFSGTSWLPCSSVLF